MISETEHRLDRLERTVRRQRIFLLAAMVVAVGVAAQEVEALKDIEAQSLVIVDDDGQPVAQLTKDGFAMSQGDRTAVSLGLNKDGEPQLLLISADGKSKTALRARSKSGSGMHASSGEHSATVYAQVILIKERGKTTWSTSAADR